MKNFLIVGASSGIGQQLAQSLAQNGHNIFSTYRNNEVKTEMQGLNYHHLDVMDENLNLDFLPDSLDGVVYCPGSINLKPFNRFKPEAFKEDYDLQVIGAIKVLQNVLPKLKEGNGGSVVFFSTVAVQMGFNFHSQVSASKGALEGLTRALAAELAPSIRVNCIAPSLTDTPMAGKLLNTEEKKENNGNTHPLKRVGRAEDIASMAEYLLDDKASWITGQVMHVDGGVSAVKS